MKRKVLILLILIFQICFSGYSQNIDFSNSKKVRLKETNFIIELPSGFKVETTKASDFLGYSIFERNKDNEDNFQIWLYLGYFPKSMADGNYQMIDSIRQKILNDTVIFRIYKSERDYLIEGEKQDNNHIIETQVFFDEHLKLYMWGKGNEYKDIENILDILKTLDFKI